MNRCCIFSLCFYALIHICVPSFPFKVLWPALIKKHGGRISDALDISSLSKISDGYTPGHIINAIKSVLTERRIQQVRIALSVILYDQLSMSLSPLSELSVFSAPFSISNKSLIASTCHLPFNFTRGIFISTAASLYSSHWIV